MDKFILQSFGCRASQADGAALEALLLTNGMQSARQTDEAAWVVLNSCTVTATAESDLRQTIRRTHQQNPDARIVVTGCYAQRAPEELARLPGVALVVGNTHKQEIPALLRGNEYHGQIHIGDIFSKETVFSAPNMGPVTGRARPALKIQDGCNNRCSFCIIPSVRGRSRSLPADEVIEQVRALSEYAEVVLTGINLGRWGRESGKQMRLSDLLQRLLGETAVQRIRLSSVEPMDWTGELIGLVADSPRIAKHMHMPLQSGSDAVLRRMHRKYRPRHYEDRLRRAHELMPDAAFGADVMTGFPGETEDEFEQTRQFIEQLPFTYLHVFTYSERPGTAAESLEGAVPQQIRKRRTRELQALGIRKNQAFRQRMVGRTLSAVTLVEPRTALTSNFLKVELAHDRPPNQLIDLQIGSMSGSALQESGRLPVLG